MSKTIKVVPRSGGVVEAERIADLVASMQERGKDMSARIWQCDIDEGRTWFVDGWSISDEEFHERYIPIEEARAQQRREWLLELKERYSHRANEEVEFAEAVRWVWVADCLQDELDQLSSADAGTEARK